MHDVFRSFAIWGIGSTFTHCPNALGFCSLNTTLYMVHAVLFLSSVQMHVVDTHRLHDLAVERDGRVRHALTRAARSFLTLPFLDGYPTRFPT